MSGLKDEDSVLDCQVGTVTSKGKSKKETRNVGVRGQKGVSESPLWLRPCPKPPEAPPTF